MIELLILIACVIFSLSIGFFVFLRNPKQPVNQVYGLLTLSFVGIGVANYPTLSFSDYTLLSMRAVIFFTTVCVTAIYFIVLLIQPNHSRILRQTVNRFILLFSIFIACLNLTPAVFSHLEVGTDQPVPVPEFGVIFFAAHFIGMIIISLVYLFKGIRSNKGVERSQYLYILAGLLPILILAPTTSIMLPVLLQRPEFIFLTPLYIAFFVAMVAYAMIKHQLFDIKLAAVRSAAYVLAVSTLASIYYLLAFIVSVTLFKGETTMAVSINPINIFLALVLALIFQPIKQFFDQVTNKIFYRDRYSSEGFFEQLSELLASTTDLRGILERASLEIAATLKAEQAFFFLYYTNSANHHISSGTKGHSRLPLLDAHTLDAYVMSHDDRIILTDLLSEDESIRRLLISHEITLVMPLRHKSRIIGYVCLGDQLSGGYNKRDLKVLTTISNELVIAIQNALSVHEVREINATLQQRIHVATAELRESNSQLHRLDVVKDEFVSMASHQLRTPLTSVKGYISMMLDGDVGRITDMQRHALEEAFNSSERMVRLIGDFLSVSRLQTGKFIIDRKPVDLVKVIGQEVDGLRLIASTHGQKLSYVHPKQLQLINLDESKIRQVIMNFIDNAIYYSGANSTIHIALGKIRDEVVFTVEDPGIGVPKDQQPKLFSKFYRATNARQQRPDGTGVGLYLAKKVIIEHDGKVIFSSVENQGSTFGFRMPLNQKANETDDHNNESK
jgi:signal transduction histidine kinase